jgi:magnesium chelatase family protein
MNSWTGEFRSPICCRNEYLLFLIRVAMSQINLSAHAYHRILKLSRIIADLAGCEEIQSPHLAEALQYRPKIMM